MHDNEGALTHLFSQCRTMVSANRSVHNFFKRYGLHVVLLVCLGYTWYANSKDSDIDGAVDSQGESPSNLQDNILESMYRPAPVQAYGKYDRPSIKEHTGKTAGVVNSEKEISTNEDFEDPAQKDEGVMSSAAASLNDGRLSEGEVAKVAQQSKEGIATFSELLKGGSSEVNSIKEVGGSTTVEYRSISKALEETCEMTRKNLRERFKQLSTIGDGEKTCIDGVLEVSCPLEEVTF